MTPKTWITIGLFGASILAYMIGLWFNNRPRRPLSDMRPTEFDASDDQLGLEATDQDAMEHLRKHQNQLSHSPHRRNTKRKTRLFTKKYGDKNQ